MGQLWTPQIAADKTGVSVLHIRRLIRKGAIDASRIRNRVFIDPTTPKNETFISQRTALREASENVVA